MVVVTGAIAGGGGDYFSLQKLQVCFFLGNLEFNKWDFKLDYLKLT